MKLIKPQQHLYEVYAQADPNNDNLSAIGKIVAKSYATTSYFADESLFFQHTRFEDDLKYYPSWEKKAKDILTVQRNILGEGYHYPDLPFN